jgi:hypothetical protein
MSSLIFPAWREATIDSSFFLHRARRSVASYLRPGVHVNASGEIPVERDDGAMRTLSYYHVIDYESALREISQIVK